MLAEVVREASNRFGDRPALFTLEGWQFSYRELDRASDEVAAWLHRTVGVSAGSTAAIMAPTSVEYLVYYAAFAKLGAVTGGVNPHLTERERRAVLDACQPDVVVGLADLLDGAEGHGTAVELTLADGPADVCRGQRLTGEAPAALPPDPDRPIAIAFTSGSTGEPKGALFRYRQMEAIFRMDAGSTWGGGVPTILGTQFAHIGAMTKAHWLLAGGATLHVMRKWRAADVLRLTAEHRMPALNAGPTQIALLLRQPDFDDYDLSCVKAIIAGTGPSSPAIIQEARRRLHCGVLGALLLDRVRRRGPRHCARRARRGDPVHGRAAPPRRRGQGRRRRGPRAARRRGRRGVDALGRRDERVLAQRARGHARDARRRLAAHRRPRPDRRARLLPAGRAEPRRCTSAAGTTCTRSRSSGCWPTTRRSTRSRSCPGADAVMGEIGEACVVPRDAGDPPSLDELRDFGADGLARFKLPERIRVLDALPLNASDKLDRKALSALDA